MPKVKMNKTNRKKTIKLYILLTWIFYVFHFLFVCSFVLNSSFEIRSSSFFFVFFVCLFHFVWLFVCCQFQTIHLFFFTHSLQINPHPKLNQLILELIYMPQKVSSSNNNNNNIILLFSLYPSFNRIKFFIFRLGICQLRLLLIL